MRVASGKEYKDMTADEQFIYDSVDFVEQLTDDEECEFTGYAIQINGSGGFGSMDLCESMDGQKVIVVTSIFGNFEMDDIDKCADEIRFRARLIVKAFMSERIEWHPRSV